MQVGSLSSIPLSSFNETLFDVPRMAGSGFFSTAVLALLARARRGREEKLFAVASSCGVYRLLAVRTWLKRIDTQRRE